MTSRKRNHQEITDADCGEELLRKKTCREIEFHCSMNKTLSIPEEQNRQEISLGDKPISRRKRKRSCYKMTDEIPVIQCSRNKSDKNPRRSERIRNRNQNRNDQNSSNSGSDSGPNDPPFPPIIFIIDSSQLNDSGSHTDGSDTDGEIEDITTPTSDLEPQECPGKNCDHQRDSETVPVIPERFHTMSGYDLKLQDLIDLGACYHCKCQRKFKNISLERLAIIHDSITRLQSLIGLSKLKDAFVEQILYFMLDDHPNPAEMLHTVLEGPPGVGKSLLCEILADIYLKLGYLKNNIVHRVTITNLKGKWVGHTAPLTQKAIDQAQGGILIIDEVYSLGSSDKLDSFSKEIIDTLTRNLTEHAGEFICIIAGYTKQIEECVFAHNEGLRSRFRFRFVIDGYSANELRDIILLKIQKDKWNFRKADMDQLTSFFDKNVASFKDFGRDVETLFYHTKVCHTRRMAMDTDGLSKEISVSDLLEGYKRFVIHKKIKDSDDAEPWQSMFR